MPPPSCQKVSVRSCWIMARRRDCDRLQKSSMSTTSTLLDSSFQPEQNFFQRQLLDLADFAAWKLLQHEHLIDHYADIIVILNAAFDFANVDRSAQNDCNPYFFESRNALDPARRRFFDFRQRFNNLF